MTDFNKQKIIKAGVALAALVFLFLLFSDQPLSFVGNYKKFIAGPSETVSGTVYTDEGSTNIGAGKTVRVAVNGTDHATTDDTDSGGAYSITGVPLASGDVITVYLEDETEDAVTVTVSNGGSISGLDLYQNRLITRHDNSGSLTNANLSTAAVSGEADISNIYSTSGDVLTVQTNKELFILSGHTFDPGANCILDDVDINGAFTIGLNDITVEGSWDATGGSFSSTSGSVTFSSASSETIISNGSSFEAFNTAGSGGTFVLEDTLDVDNSLDISSGDTLDVKSGENNTINITGNWTNSGTFTARSGTVNFNSNIPVTISSGGSSFYNIVLNGNVINTIQLSGNLDVNGNLTITAGATFDALGNNINLAGNWTNNGTFQSASGTSVTFDGTSQTIEGATTFYNFVKTEGVNNATDETLTFTASQTFTIENNLTLDGRDADDRINIISTISGTAATIDFTGGSSFTGDFLDVKDNTVTDNSTGITLPLDPANSVDSGGTTGWFTDSVSGTVYTDEGTTNIGANKTVRVAINGTDHATTDETDASGAYSITDVTLSSGDVITVYLEDETEDAVTVTVSNGSAISDLNLYQNRLITRHDNSGSLTNANLSTAAVSGEADIISIYGVSAGALTVASGKELFILSSHTFAPGAAVTVDDIDINGTFTMAANSVTVSGVWDATGGSFTSSGTVTFNATTSETIFSDGDAFNNITFNGAGGTWTLEDALDVNGNLTVTTGTLDTKSGENNSINVAGDYTINGTFVPRNGTVTFDGSGFQPLAGTDRTFYNLTINNSASSPGDSNDVDSSAAVTVTNTLTVTDGQFQPSASSDFVDISIGANGILKPDVSASVTVSGNWTDNGTFTANTGTVTFDGTSQTIEGPTTFYNFVKTEGVNNATDETLTFTAGQTFTIGNTLTLDGRDADDRINILSTSAGTAATIDFTGSSTFTGDFLDVKDNTVTDNSTGITLPLDPANSVNSGGTTGWFTSSTPTVSSVTSDKTNGSYTTGEVIDVQITFSETVDVTGTPQLTLETGSTDQVIDYLSGSGSTVLTFRYTVQSGDTSSDLDYASTSALALNSGTIKANDDSTNATLTLPTVGGASSIAGSKAIVIDTTAPTLDTATASNIEPDDNATGVAVGLSSLTAIFTEVGGDITKGTGNVTVKKTSDNSTVKTIDVTTGSVSVSGDTVTITLPAGDLDNLTEYYINIAATAFDDTAGNSYAGLSSTTAWSFTAGGADVTPPTVSSLSPADDSSSVNPSSDLIITFSETVVAGSGNIVIKDLGDSSTFETISVSGSQVSVSGSTVTINPSTNLLLAHSYYINIDSGAFEDLAANDYTGISNQTTWNFGVNVPSGPPTDISSKISLVGYRWYDHFGSSRSDITTAQVGPPLAATNKSAIIPQAGVPFRLRLLLHVADKNITVSDQKKFKLQYATKSGSCDVNFSGEDYIDIGGAVNFYDADSLPQDEARFAASLFDPNVGHSVALQSYEEQNPFRLRQNINQTWDGLWDFALALKDSRAEFCFRVVEENGTLLDGYSVLPELGVNIDFSSQEILKIDETPRVVDPVTLLAQETLNSLNDLKIPEGTLNPYNVLTLGSDKDLVILPGDQLPSLGILQSKNTEDRWNIAGNIIEVNKLVVHEPSVFEGDVIFKGQIVRFGNNTITLNPGQNRAIFGRNPNSGIVFGDGDNTSFSFLDANDNADLVGRKELVKIIDSGDSADLHVTGGAIFNQDGTPTEFRVQGATNPNLFVINPTTEITSVSGRLDVGRAIVANSDNSRGMTFFRYSNVVGESSFISFRRHRGTFSTPTAVQQNDFLGKFDFQGYDGAARQTSAIFSAVVDGPVSPGKVPTGFIISTGSNSANLPVRLRVTSQGLVGINTSDPTHTLTVAGDLRVTGRIFCDDPALCDIGGGGGGGSDTTAPVISNLNPANNATGFNIAGNLTITFSEAVRIPASSTNYQLTINKAGGASEIIDLTSPRVTGIGSNSLIINPANDFTPDSTYYVLIDATALEDLAGNGFAGISSNTTWRFTTVAAPVDTTAPTVTNVTSDKANGTYGNGEIVDIKVIFSEVVNVVGTPRITLETGSTDRAINYSSGSGSNTLVFNYTVQATDINNDLDYISASALALNGGTIKDDVSNNAILTLPAPGQSNSLSVNKDIKIGGLGPVISNLNPPHLSVNVSANTDLTITFDKAIKKGTSAGTLEICVSRSGIGVFECHPVSSGRVVVSGSTATIDLFGPLSYSTNHFITISQGAFEDLSGNQFIGITNNNEWNFTIEDAPDTTAPTTTSFSPADNATNIATSASLVITFSENIVKGTGNITIKKSSDNTTIQTIGVTSASVSVSGSNVTITPAALAAGTGFYVNIAAGAFKDAVGNNFSGIASNVAWNFTTAPPAAPVDTIAPIIVSLTPANGATNVAINTDLTLTFSEDVKKGTTGIDIYKVSDPNQYVQSTAAIHSSVTVSGNVVTVRTLANLEPNTQYFIIVRNNFVSDMANNAFAGIASNTVWRFTTASALKHEGTTSAVGLSISNLAGSLAGNQLYLAAITLNNSSGNTSIPNISGVSYGGLSWHRVRRQCAGSDIPKGVSELWTAYGQSSGGQFLATTIGTNASFGVAVSHYSGALPLNEAVDIFSAHAGAQNDVSCLIKSNATVTTGTITNLSMTNNNTSSGSHTWVVTNVWTRYITTPDDHVKTLLNTLSASQTINNPISQTIYTDTISSTANEIVNHQIAGISGWEQIGVIIRPQ